MDVTEGDFAADVDAAVARNVKKARERADLSQADVAKLMTEAGVPSIHQTTVARIENGQRALRLGEALVLARILDYRVEELAESTASAALHESYDYLRKGIEGYREAARELLYRRRMTALTLDGEFPLTVDGSPSVGAFLKVNPAAYDVLDELLVSNSSPAEILDDLYREERRKFLVMQWAAFTSSRMSDLHDELISDKYWFPLKDFREFPDADFEAKVLRRFGLIDA